MSAVPNSQLEGLLAGGQLLGQAAQNQQITYQNQAQQRAAGLEARGQDLQNVMQQRQLGAEAQNYRKLNESRERMQNQELAQQESQFSRGLDQDRELKMFDYEMAMAIRQEEAMAAAKAAEIMAGQKDDATLRRLRGERIAHQDRALRLEQSLNSTRTAKALSIAVKDERLKGANAKLTSFHEATKALGDQARDSMGEAVSDAILENTRQSGGFIGESIRSGLSTFEGAEGVGLTTGVAPATGMVKVFFENLVSGVFEVASEDATRARMTQFENHPGVFATKVIEHAFNKYDDAFGLKGDQKEAAKATMVALLAKASDSMNLSASGATQTTKETRELARAGIAEQIGKLRGYGMQDVQILAMFNALEGLSENSSRILTEQGLGPTGVEGAKGAILQKTLTGVGNLIDAIQEVTLDTKLMTEKGGGKLTDHLKFDMPKVFRMAEQAYAMDRSSPQMQELTSEIRRVGIQDPKQVEDLVTLLIENDPELQRLGFDLDPKEIADMVLKLENQQTAMTSQGNQMVEEEQFEVQKYKGRGAQEMAQFEADAFGELMANVRSRQGG